MLTLGILIGLFTIPVIMFAYGYPEYIRKRNEMREIIMEILAPFDELKPDGGKR